MKVKMFAKRWVRQIKCCTYITTQIIIHLAVLLWKRLDPRSGRRNLISFIFAVVVVAMIIGAQFMSMCLWPVAVFRFSAPKLTVMDTDDVTVVTGFFRLAEYEKLNPKFKLQTYLKWAEVFGFLQNRLIVYTDTPHMENLLLQMRCAYDLCPRTRVIRLRREDLTSFRQVSKIQDIYNHPTYPKLDPDTMYPLYSASQNAKYELMLNATTTAWDFHTTKYIAWVDIGYFRHFHRRRKMYYVTKPLGMRINAVAMTEISSRDGDLTAAQIFQGGYVWVGGGMSLAERGRYERFAREYLSSVEYFLSMNLSASDQQVLYAMFSKERSHQVTSLIQPYRWWLSGLARCWFYLGLLGYREVE